MNANTSAAIAAIHKLTSDKTLNRIMLVEELDKIGAVVATLTDALLEEERRMQRIKG